MSSQKEKLLALEKTGKYVFHGSGREIEIFEPRQAYNYIAGEQIPDGEPAVFASSAVEYAILMAIINKDNCPRGLHSSAGTSTRSDGSTYLRFRISKDTLAQLSEDSEGWIYVFNKSLFSLRDKGGVEYVSTKTVIPLERIKVRREDLPEKIEVFE